MAARITKYLNKYVRTGLCLIYISSFYFWSPPLARKRRKNNVLYYPELETESGTKLSHNGCTADNFDIPDHGFLLLTCSTGPMEWSTGNSYQAEALTNVLRIGPVEQVRSKKPWSGMSKLSAVQPLWLNFVPLSVSRIAWHTCIIPQNV
jgi:hypothetical protein